MYPSGSSKQDQTTDDVALVADDVWATWYGADGTAGGSCSAIDVQPHHGHADDSAGYDARRIACFDDRPSPAAAQGVVDEVDALVTAVLTRLPPSRACPPTKGRRRADRPVVGHGG